MLKPIDDLVPDIAAAAAEIERGRRLPDPLVDDLKAAGAFRALIPAQLGGLDAPFEDYLGTVQRLAAADASTAWCVNQAAVIGLTSLWLPETQAREIWSDPATSVANGPPFDCRIEPVEGGFRLNGHWGFSSGCQHAVWMMGAAKCTAGGYRIAFFRPDVVTFTDNWQVAGLRGTGSFEFKVSDLMVAAPWVGDMAQHATTQTELTRVPNTLLFAVSFAAVALGVASATIEDVLDIARDKTPRFSARPLAQDPDVQRFVGKATARWRAADAYLHATVSRVMDEVRTDRTISHDARSRLRMAGTHVIRECAEVVDLAYKVSGSTGIYQHEALQRRYQDMHVITQHVQGREAYFRLLGRYAISGDYEIGPMT